MPGYEYEYDANLDEYIMPGMTKATFTRHHDYDQTCQEFKNRKIFKRLEVKVLADEYTQKEI